MSKKKAAAEGRALLATAFREYEETVGIWGIGLGAEGLVFVVESEAVGARLPQQYHGVPVTFIVGGCARIAI
jgi:hypothetical protein